ncbi:hypothetical protein EV361DRAFT_868916 [Lentinula raphanica]|uniref:Uncharacterized protein n=1 Tax=Lentinula raphanica TaxID=153919 RepID=A0AA38UG73_9AGAR|nr:hypothetical protein C8R42DRAFT_652791 [Lentinula raphanica]KAJ3821521.1 hypothetical protein F5880DRAFT_1581462 [Lentinula raphanica]KAJ3840000.1 hypothetical protein F5878DRAFT_659796 [Lentinula raphanica]KAJ3970889.1 hypothetical protein EV361DRAFT_868916 [Lentinula raphanica]
MAEEWQLVSVDNRASSGHLGKLKKFFWNPSRAVSFLKAVVVPSTYKLDTRTPGDQAKAQRAALESQSSALLLTLPIELLLIIAEDLGKDYLHLLCFSLTCTFLWEITGHARYHSLCSELKKESWSGSRIILIGDRAKGLPKSMLTHEDKQELGLPRQRKDIRFNVAGRAFYRVAQDSFRNFSHIPNDLILGDRRVRTNSKLRGELLNANRNEQCMRWISINRDNCVLKRQDGDFWMLRNLSQREYVLLPHSRVSKVSVTQVLYSLVGESEYSYCSYSDGDEGKWAGDRIDLTVLSIHQQEHGNDAKWMDITFYIIQQLEELAYETEFPEEVRALMYEEEEEEEEEDLEESD